MTNQPKETKLTTIENVEELDDLTPEGQRNAIAGLIAKAAAEGKESPASLNGLNFRDFLKRKFGDKDASKILGLLYQMGGLISFRGSFFPQEITAAKVERVELIETAKLNRKYENLEAYDASFLKHLRKTITNSYSKYPLTITPFKPSTKPNQGRDQERELNVVLSDLHLQSMIKKAETGNEYGAEQEARRLAFIAQQVANYKLDHRDHTNLNVLLLGDIIQNQLHDPRDGTPIAWQMQAAVYLLTQVVGYWASAFKQVTVYCATGNHGRNTSRHKTRASTEKWDSLETEIYYSLKCLFNNTAPNVKVVMPQTPWVDFATLGHHVYATHGDTVFSPGNPGKTVDVQRLEVQVNKANASRVSRRRRQAPYEVFVAGHVHRGLEVYLDSGTTVFINAPLCPPDGFANSIGIYNTQCGQWLWETTNEYAIGDHRLIRVGEEQDKDRKLDKIIKPFMSFGQVAEIKKFERDK